MANRHLSRSIVLQTLFEWDVQKEHDRSVDALVVLERQSKEFAPDAGDFSFMKNIVNGVIAKQQEIDSIIEKAAPEWPIEKISPIDRNILRIGLYELLFCDRSEVPAKVAINEAIELGKNFGGESSGRFINGVLGAVYKDIGEPGKDEQTKKKKRMGPTKKLCGAVVFSRKDQDLHFALVHDVFGRWTLSKTKCDDGESEETCALRAVKKELGLTGKVIKHLGINEYEAADPEEGKIIKQVSYFLVEVPFKELEFKKDGGLDDAKWFVEEELGSLNLYDDIHPIIEKAITILK